MTALDGAGMSDVLNLTVRVSITCNEGDETPEQLAAGYIYWPCPFCGFNVLINAFRHTREKCPCGARRCSKGDSDGWRKDDVVWWVI